MSTKTPLYQINPSAFITVHPDGVLCLVVATTQRRFEVKEEFLSVFSDLSKTGAAELAAFAANLNHEWLHVVDDGKTIVDWSLACGLLIPVDEADRQMLWIRYGWRHALYFHLLTSRQMFVEAQVDDPREIREAVAAQIASYGEDPPLRTASLGTDRVALPGSTAIGGAAETVSIGEALLMRRTTRAFARTAITAGELGSILAAAAPLATQMERTRIALRDGQLADVVGASYVGLELYVSVQTVEDIDPGLYRYLPKQGELTRIRTGDHSDVMFRIANGQVVNGCAAVVIVCGRFSEVAWRYRTSRALRKVYVETGALAQRLLVTATANAVESFVTPATQDSLLEGLLELDPRQETPLYLVGLGHARSRRGPRNEQGI